MLYTAHKEYLVVIVSFSFKASFSKVNATLEILCFPLEITWHNIMTLFHLCLQTLVRR